MYNYIRYIYGLKWKWPWQKFKVTGEGQRSQKMNKWWFLVKHKTHRHHTWYQGTLQKATSNDISFLDLQERSRSHHKVKCQVIISKKMSQTWRCLRSLNASCLGLIFLFMGSRSWLRFIFGRSILFLWLTSSLRVLILIIDLWRGINGIKSMEYTLIDIKCAYWTWLYHNLECVGCL